MTSNESPSAVPPVVQLPRTRSFPNAMAALLFSHRAWSSTDNDYVAQMPIQTTTTEDDQRTTSRAVSISGGLFGSHHEQGGFNWIDPDTNFSKASPPSSSSSSSTPIRRSETWATSLQRPNDHSQNAMRPTNETSAGSVNLRSLQRSLSEVFGPSRIVIDMTQEVRYETPGVSINQTSSRTSSSPLKISASSHPDVSRPTPLAAEPDHSHPKSVLKRQSSLAAVPESEPMAREVLPSPAHSNVEDRPLKPRLFSMPGTVAEATSIDENQNAVGHKNYEGALKMAAGEMTSHDHVMQVPETTFSRPSRRLGIMELLGSGERRKIRNRDVNLVAPQSW